MSLDASTFTRWLDKHIELLQKERAAEVEETGLLLTKCAPQVLAKKGLAILNLGVASFAIGLGGRMLVELERPSAHHESPIFPSHLLRTGDIAALLELSDTSKASKAKSGKSFDEMHRNEGVIYRVTDTRIILAIQQKDGEKDNAMEFPQRLMLVKLANDAVFDRKEKTLIELRKRVVPADSSDETLRPDPLTSVLLGIGEPTYASATESFKLFDANLNDSQRRAVEFCLSANEIALVHGPPGTGKTSTLVEITRQLVAQGKRCLVCGASNLAVDNLVERLVPHSVPLTRIGHPARVLQSIHTSTLDYQSTNSDAAAIVKDIKNEIDGIMSELGKGKVKGKDRKEKWTEVKTLRKEYRSREHRVTESVMTQARVVLATCHGAGSRQLNNMQFDVAIIDEAAQALEADCWIPILKASKVILAGDHLQLPPTVKSETSQTKSKPVKPKRKAPEKDEAAATEAADIKRPKPSKLIPPSTLSYTLFDRLMAMHGDRISRLLTIQYRMHTKIMRFPADELYESKLIASENVKGWLLCDLPGASDEEDTLREPLVFIDTNGSDMFERINDEEGVKSDSRFNENEAELVKAHLQKLIASGISPAHISIISPYQAQVSLLSNSIKKERPEIEIGSVDGFQGRENEVVILSLVRSNDKKEVGFLSDHRRLNVAMTRPKRQLCIVGDSGTVSKGTSFLKRWMDHLEDHADVEIAGM